MRDFIYIPLILMQTDWCDNHFPVLIENVKMFSTPRGVEILSVMKEEDWLTENLLNALKTINYTVEDDSPNIWVSPEYLIRIEFEVEEKISQKELPWFEDQLIKLVDDKFYASGLYFFYLVDEGRNFKVRNVMKVFPKDGGSKIILDNQEDDMTFILEAAPYYSHYLYQHDEIPIGEAYPAETAKYLLIDICKTNPA